MRAVLVPPPSSMAHSKPGVGPQLFTQRVLKDSYPKHIGNSFSRYPTFDYICKYLEPFRSAVGAKASEALLNYNCTIMGTRSGYDLFFQGRLYSSS